MDERTPFVGTGHNPEGPDLPLGFGMQLAQEPRAMDTYGRMSDSEKASVVRYIRNAPTGDEVKNRIAGAVHALKENRTDFF